MKRKITELPASGSNRRLVSYGVLLYKKDKSKDNNQEDETTIRYLLGLIPQRNWWTVFKGIPNDDETPTETALREFEEETGTKSIIQKIVPETTLNGKTSKKDLVIFLQDGSSFSTDCFDLTKVVKIDQGYMKGKPEIVQIRWLSFAEALNGTDGAKIYTSQRSILQDAHQFLLDKQKKEKEQKLARQEEQVDEAQHEGEGMKEKGGTEKVRSQPSNGTLDSWLHKK